MTRSSISGVMAVDAFYFWIPPDLKSLRETLAQEEERGQQKRSDGGNSEVFQHHDFLNTFGRLVHRFVEITTQYCTVLNISILRIDIYIYLYDREGRKDVAFDYVL